MENAHLKTNEEFIIPGSNLSTISVDGYSLVCGTKYNTNTIPVKKDVLKRAGAVFSGEKKETPAVIEQPIYSRKELEEMNMTALRAIGAKYGLTDNKKIDLVDKIMAKVR